MKIGILSDIHESNDYLVNAIDLLGRRKVDQYILLGDIFETGREVREILIHNAVFEGWCSELDTQECVLTPIYLG